MTSEDELKRLHIDLEATYEKVAAVAIKKGLITKDEWTNRFKFYRDECGHSFVHLLECKLASKSINVFLTSNKLLLDSRQELQKRFGIEILTVEEFNDKIKQEVKSQ
jgi:predicted nucleic acid-binding protein